MRIFIHVQALSGAGHYVRAFEIARALAERHEVFLIDGGWAVPRRPAPVTPVPLPRIERVAGGLRALPGHGALADALRRRVTEMAGVIADVRPEVLVVEHFPFSKWDLEAEYRAVIAAARSARPTVKVVCSVRDVAARTRFDDGAAWTARPYRQRVLDALDLFDLVLVHADPRFTRIEAHVPWIGESRTPLRYTGFVSEKLPAVSARRDEVRAWLGSRGMVVAATGGGKAGDPLLAALVQAWRGLAGDARIDRHALVVFRPLRSDPDESERLCRLAGDGAVRVEGFDPGFLEWLSLADCCVSRAGYNACTNLLETRCRSLLAPDRSMSDQPFRAQRLAELGLAEVLDEENPATWAGALGRALRAPRPVHDLALDGAAQTRSLLEAL